MKEFATVITDASHCPNSGAAGWAGRVIIDGQRFTFSGPLKGKFGTSTEAEIAAMVNTLHVAYRKEVLVAGTCLLLQIDNERARRIIGHIGNNANYNAANLSERELIIREKLREIWQEFNPPRITIKHVKAHKKFHERQANNHVHEVMDRLAKKGMREARETLGGAPA